MALGETWFCIKGLQFPSWLCLWCWPAAPVGHLPHCLTQTLKGKVVPLQGVPQFQGVRTEDDSLNKCLLSTNHEPYTTDFKCGSLDQPHPPTWELLRNASSSVYPRLKSASWQDSYIKLWEALLDTVLGVHHRSPFNVYKIKVQFTHICQNLLMAQLKI